MKKNILLGRALGISLLMGNILFIGNIAQAENLKNFTLDPMVITAQRMAVRDLHTPATTEVITQEDIQKKGFVSVFDALNQTIGIQSYSYTGGQGDNGSSTGRVYVRGLDKGTLILVNGAPLNLNNYNSTAGIPMSAIERIEVVKGSNSVLYGSEAMGGVINIITKKAGAQKNTLSITGGNYDKAWEATSQGEEYLISLGRQYFDAQEDTSNRGDINYRFDRRKYTKDNLFATFNLTDKLAFNYLHTETNGTGMHYLNPDGTQNKTEYSYDDERDNVALIYDDAENNFKSNLTYNRRRVDGTQYKTNGSVGKSGASSNYILYSLNFDNSKLWNLGDKASLLAGITANKEDYKEIIDSSHTIDRDSLGVYMSYNQAYNDKFSTILGVRGHFVKDNGFDGGHNEYLPQLQTLYKIDENTSWYTNIGKSFEMPAINSKYSRSGTGSNGAIKPQEGWTYETGIKHVTDDSILKLAIFDMRMKNKFEWRSYDEAGITPPPGIDGDTKIQVNLGKFKNTGIELAYDKYVSEQWKYNLGATYQNPQAREDGKWEQVSAKLQLTAGTNYTYEKLGLGLNIFYSGDREQMGKIDKNGSLNPRDIVTLNAVVSYTPAKNHNFKLNLYNLLDRDNEINPSRNLDRPFNWTLSYDYSF